MQPATTTTALPAHERTHEVTLARLALLMLGVAMLAIMCAFVAYRVVTPSDMTIVSGSTPWAAEGITVAPLPGISSAFREGDVVVSVDGQSVEAWLAEPRSAALAAGLELSFGVEREGELLTVPVRLGSYPLLPVLTESWALVLLVTTMFAVGTAVYLRRPREAAARALFVAGAAMLTSSVIWLLGLQIVDVLTGTGLWLYLLGTGGLYSLFFGGLLHFALVFPRPVPLVARRPGLLAVAYAAPFGIQLVALGAGIASTPNRLEWIGAWLSGLLLMQATVVLVAMALVFAQYRRSDAAARGQLRWVAVAAVVASLGTFAFWFGPELMLGAPLLPWNAAALVGLPFPLALGAAVHRHGLFDMSSLVNRSLVYGALTVAILLTYSLVVALLGALLPTDAPYAVTLLAIGVAALVALPLRDRLQRGINRLMYGDRDEPYRAIARLGERLEASQAVLPTVVATVAQALRLPYVAVSLDTAEGQRTAASHGKPNKAPLLRLPLAHRGEMVGELVLAPRSADETFTAADQRLLNDLARQAGAAAYGVRLTGELQRSREHLVVSREEERRRLRRDLHDELGPTLAGSLMKLEAARSLLQTDTGAASSLLGELAAETRRAIEEVRRLARDLRPPALDELGLLVALREEAARFAAQLSISVEAPDDLPPLSAAVEVAAFRIALESLTNVSRHSGAGRAWLRISNADGWLIIEVSDDGRGIPPTQRSGVGWTSMRERASELGGSCDFGPAPEGGTRVVARLPLGGGP
jgi:signal transduction histidine kinase